MSNGYENHKGAIESARAGNGTFGHQKHGEAPISLEDHQDQLRLAVGDGDDYTEFGDGEVIEDIYVENTGDGYLARSRKRIYNVAGLIADATGLTDKAAEWTLENERAKAKEFLAARYGADVDDSEGSDWTLEFAVELENHQLNGKGAADAIWEKTKLTAAHNEQDHGTYGSENLGRLMADALNIQSRHFA